MHLSEAGPAEAGSFCQRTRGKEGAEGSRSLWKRWGVPSGVARRALSPTPPHTCVLVIVFQPSHCYTKLPQEPFNFIYLIYGGKLRRKEAREREIALRSSSNSEHLPPTRREVRRRDGGNWHHPAPPLKTAQGNRAVKGDKNTPLPSWTSSPFN